MLSQDQINSLYAGGEATIGGGPVGALPATTAVQIAAGSALDLSGLNQTIGSLSDEVTTNSGGTVTNSGGTLATLTVAPSGGSPTTFSGVIQDGNAPTALTINGNGTQVLAGANTFSGPTTLTAGTLQLNNTNALQNSTVTLTTTGGALAFGTGVGAVNLGGLAGNANLALDDLGNNAVTLQVGGNNSSTTYSGVLSGDGGLTKAGTGLLALTSVNTYRGATGISQGTLQLAGPAPVMHIAFDGSGAVSHLTVFPDSSGNGLNMVDYSAPWNGSAAFVPGKFGNALKINNGTMVVIGAYNPLTDTVGTNPIPTMNSWTVSQWVDIPSTSSGNISFFGHNQFTGDNGMAMWYDTTSGNFSNMVISDSEQWIVNSSDGSHQIPAPLSADTWHLVTETVTTGQLNLYVDGNYAGQTLFNGTPQFDFAGSTLQLGFNVWTGWSVPYSTDDFQLFGSVLTQAQIQAMFANGSANGNLPATTTLVIGSAGVLDLNATSQTVVSLSDSSNGGGIVTNSGFAPVTLTVQPAGSSATFSGSIQDGVGPTALTLNGPGTQVLAGSNTYSGLTTINAGTLQIGSGGTTGSIDGTSGVVNNGLLAFDRSDNVAFTGNIGGSGGVQQIGTGVLQLTGLNSYSGATTITQGTLQVTASPLGALSPLMHITFNLPAGPIANGATIPDSRGNGLNMTAYTYWGGSPAIVAGKFGNAMQFNPQQGGQVAAIGAYNPITDTWGTNPIPTLTTWSASLWVNIPSTTPTGNIPLFGHQLWGDNGAALWYNSTSGYLQAMLVNSADNNWFVQNQYSTTLSPDTWHLVTETVGAGQLDLYVDGSLIGLTALTDTPQFDFSGSVLSLGFNQWTGFGPGPFSLEDFQLYGSVLTQAQVATMFANAGSGGSLPSGTPVQIAAAGVLDLAGINSTIGSLADSGNSGGGTVTNTSATPATLTLAPTGGSTTFSGSIQDGALGGQVALTLNGAGTQVLSGVNTYSGPTTITAGTLQMGSDTALPTATPLTIDSLGVLDLGGFSATVASLSDGPFGGGIVTNSGATLSTLTLAHRLEHLQRLDPGRHGRRPDRPDPQRPRHANPHRGE